MLDSIRSFITKEWREVATQLRPPVAQHAPDEAVLIERASEGGPARQFLESRQVQDFMSSAEANLTHAMLDLPLDDDGGRRNLAVAVQTLRQLRSYLIALAQDGQSAERELERLRSGQKGYF